MVLENHRKKMLHLRLSKMKIGKNRLTDLLQNASLLSRGEILRDQKIPP